MKRAVILVVALSAVVTGFLIDGPKTRAENGSGNHFISGKVVAIESCYNNAVNVSGTCLGVVESQGNKHAGKILGDVTIDRRVYRECQTVDGQTECSKDWGTSVGELYLQGGELTQ